MTTRRPVDPVLPVSPPPEEDSTSAQVQAVDPWQAPEIPYSESFEDSVMNTVLDSKSNTRQPVYLPDPNTPPSILSSTELPLSLHDYRRKYPSPIPGILLPHPNSTLHGAAGPSEEQLLALAQELVEKHGIRNEAQLKHWLDAEEAEQRAELRKRMRRRQEAIRINEHVMREVRTLDTQRDVERKVMRSKASLKGKEDADTESSDDDISMVLM